MMSCSIICVSKFQNIKISSRCIRQPGDSPAVDLKWEHVFNTRQAELCIPRQETASSTPATLRYLPNLQQQLSSALTLLFEIESKDCQLVCCARTTKERDIQSLKKSVKGTGEPQAHFCGAVHRKRQYEHQQHKIDALRKLQWSYSPASMGCSVVPVAGLLRIVCTCCVGWVGCFFFL